MAIFSGIGVLRTILDSETDDNSPLSEELMSQIRENIEAIIQLAFGRVASGTLTSDPPNNTTGWAIDTGAGFTNDEHNGRTLLFTSGDAEGNMYTIDDTEASNNRVECADDNLYADGVRSGDAYLILYDLLANTDGHDHDGVNSKKITASSVSSTGTYSGSVSCRNSDNDGTEDFTISNGLITAVGSTPD